MFMADLRFLTEPSLHIAYNPPASLAPLAFWVPATPAAARAARGLRRVLGFGLPTAEK